MSPIKEVTAMKMKYKGTEEREIPGYGLYKPGEVVEYDDTLLSTGLFEGIPEKKMIVEKEGDK